MKMTRGKVFHLVLADEQELSRLSDLPEQVLVRSGGRPLLDLCREEASRFSDYLARAGSGALTGFEAQAIASYLYQKLRGRLDVGTSATPGADPRSGDEDGTP